MRPLQVSMKVRESASWHRYWLRSCFWPPSDYPLDRRRQKGAWQARGEVADALVATKFR
jgi:hypothetical protein